MLKVVVFLVRGVMHQHLDVMQYLLENTVQVSQRFHISFAQNVVLYL